MGKKIISKTMVVLILTASGYTIPSISASIFFAMNLPGLTIINICVLISIIIAIIMGISVTFSKNGKNLDKIICIVCTLLCLYLLLFFIANISGS